MFADKAILVGGKCLIKILWHVCVCVHADRLTILPEPLLQTPHIQIPLFLLSLPSDLLGYAQSGQVALKAVGRRTEKEERI